MVVALMGAACIGLSLGLLGSGGSILTVPVLIYLLNQQEKVAIAGSLAIVGGIAASAAVPLAFRRLVHWPTVLLFGLPGMVGAWGGAAASRFVSGTFQLALFAVVMLLAAWFMWRPLSLTGESTRRASWKIGADGLAVGAVTGFVGVGGGFLIVPALAILGGLPVHLAIGTSLVIIALKSAVGFVGYVPVLRGLGLGVDWKIITSFIVIGAGSSFLGSWLGSRLPQEALKRVFASFLVLMGVFILWRNIGALLP